jgi:hypothetical protein
MKYFVGMLILIMVALSIPSAPVHAQEDNSNQAMVRAWIGLNLRECAKITCAKLALMPYGTVVTVLDQTDDQAWTQIQYGELVGWSASLWLTFGGDLTSDEPVGDLGAGTELRAVGNVLIRSCPSLRCGSLTLVPWGAQVLGYGVSSNGLWIMVGYQHPSRGPIIGWSAIGWYANEDFTFPLPELPVIE